jgi:hypothetical protein
LSNMKDFSSESGTSAIEIVPILMVFMIILNFGLGFFGVVHSGILNSIAARNYSFETFRNRTNLNYLRDIPPSNQALFFNKGGYRYHVSISETHSRDAFIVTRRPIKFSALNEGMDVISNSTEHNTLIQQLQDNEKTSEKFTGKKRDDGLSGVDPVWIKSLYGICMNSTCTPRR